MSEMYWLRCTDWNLATSSGLWGRYICWPRVSDDLDLSLLRCHCRLFRALEKNVKLKEKEKKEEEEKEKEKEKEKQKRRCLVLDVIR